jgi:hypothetical protein
MLNAAYLPHPSPNAAPVRIDLRVCVPYTGKPSIAASYAACASAVFPLKILADGQSTE